MCAEGYSSSLAAASLQEIGIARATDMIGGFLAWRDAKLPVEPCPD
jgi:rhodanese-related sulfurtransferase